MTDDEESFAAWAMVPERTVGGATDRAETRMMLRNALALLTERQRAVLVMRYFDDLTEIETARLLGVAVGTVKSQSHAALRKLRDGAPELALLLQEAAS